MARIFHTGFEHGSNEIFNNTQGDAPVTAGTPRNGSYYWRAGNFAKHTITATDELYVRFGLRFADLTNPNNIFAFFNGAVGLARVNRQTGTGRLEAWAGDAGVLGTTTNALVVDTWHLVEIHWIGHPTNGTFQVKLDGNLEINVTGADTTVGATTDCDLFALGNYLGAGNTQTHFDDLAINNTTDAGNGDNTSWIGDGKVLLMAPDGAGASTQFSRGGTDSGANWSQVEEVPPSDTDYVFSDAADDYDLYSLNDVSNAASVNAIVIWTRAKKDDAGARSFARMLKSGATEDQGADTVLTQTFVYYPEILERDPTDSALWSQSKLNALQVGTKVR